MGSSTTRILSHSLSQALGLAACESSPPPPPPSCRPIHSQSDTTSLRPLHLHDLSRLRCASETSSTTVGICAWISPLVGKFCLPTTTYNIVLLNFLHIHSSHPTILCQPHRCTAQHNTALHDTVLVPRYNYQPRYTLSQAYFIVPVVNNDPLSHLADCVPIHSLAAISA